MINDRDIFRHHHHLNRLGTGGLIPTAREAKGNQPRGRGANMENSIDMPTPPQFISPLSLGYRTRAGRPRGTWSPAKAWPKPTSPRHFRIRVMRRLLWLWPAGFCFPTVPPIDVTKQQPLTWRSSGGCLSEITPPKAEDCFKDRGSGYWHPQKGEGGSFETHFRRFAPKGNGHVNEWVCKIPFPGNPPGQTLGEGEISARPTILCQEVCFCQRLRVGRCRRRHPSSKPPDKTTVIGIILCFVRYLKPLGLEIVRNTVKNITVLF